MPDDYTEERVFVNRQGLFPIASVSFSLAPREGSKRKRVFDDVYFIRPCFPWVSPTATNIEPLTRFWLNASRLFFIFLATRNSQLATISRPFFFKNPNPPCSVLDFSFRPG